MLRRDYLQAEIEKLNLILAKILGLKKEGNFSLAEELTAQTLLEEFDTDINNIQNASVEEFEVFLNNKSYPLQKLTVLGQLLFESVYPFEETAITDAVLHKVLLVYRLLEEKHHTQSFENLNNRDMIDKFLNNRQYE